MGDPIKVLNHGFVRLDACMADDLSVVNSARVSYGQRKTGVDESDEGLINYLMKNRHGTPFEHNAFRFHIKLPIFIAREWQRHRIGSFNEMSGRYMQLPGEWYIPDYNNVRLRVGKPGAYTYVAADSTVSESFSDTLDQQCRYAYINYTRYLDDGVAPELARLFLHVNHFTEMYWTINARSLMNFLSLRNAPTAQWEIQQYAIEIEKVFMHEMPITWQSFAVKNNRVAP